MKIKFLTTFFLIIFFNFSIANEIKDYVEYYNNGKIKIKGSYIGETKIGFWNYYREDGTVKNEVSYINDEESFGIKYFNEKGVISSSGLIQGGEQVGEWLYYDDEGKLLVRLNYKDGKRDGVFIAYSKEEIPIVVGIFENDLLKDIKSIR